MRRLHNAAHHAAHRSSELRALYVFLFMSILRAWRKIPALRPRQMVMPAAILQIVVLMFAAWTPEQFVLRFAGGNFVILALIMLPLTLRPAEVKVHWVRPQE